MPWNVFIVGYDELGERQLQQLRHSKDYAFHGLLPVDKAVHSWEYDFNQLLSDALDELKEFDGSIDAIVGYWDFPTSALVPLLRRHFDLPGPDLASVLKCEHKYWSRLEQQKVVPDCVPNVDIFDPFDPDPLSTIDLDYPFWIKPIKSHSSTLGFRIDDKASFDKVIPLIRDNVGRFSRPFAEVMEYADPPAEVAETKHKTFLAERIISNGNQCTLEAYVRDGKLVPNGIVDTIRHSKVRSVLSRYLYPSRLPRDVQDRMLEITRRFIARIGFDNAPFNIEFFYDEDNDQIWLLEINSRLSRSHGALFQLVDGVTHLQTMVDLGIGIEPRMPHREGRYPYAAKHMIRVFQDGIVSKVPTEAEIRALEEELPGTTIEINVEKGMRLSELLHQDEFSYELGVIFTGAQSEEQLDSRLRYCEEKLSIEVAPLSD